MVSNYDKWETYTEAEREELIDLFGRLENAFFSSVDDSWETDTLRAAAIITEAKKRREVTAND